MYIYIYSDMSAENVYIGNCPTMYFQKALSKY
jgi:hypothetical protein